MQQESQESSGMWGSSRILPSTGTSTGTKAHEASGLEAIKPIPVKAWKGEQGSVSLGVSITNIWQTGDSGIHFSQGSEGMNKKRREG